MLRLYRDKLFGPHGKCSCSRDFDMTHVHACGISVYSNPGCSSTLNPKPREARSSKLKVCVEHVFLDRLHGGVEQNGKVAGNMVRVSMSLSTVLLKRSPAITRQTYFRTHQHPVCPENNPAFSLKS